MCPHPSRSKTIKCQLCAAQFLFWQHIPRPEVPQRFFRMQKMQKPSHRAPSPALCSCYLENWDFFCLLTQSLGLKGLEQPLLERWQLIFPVAMPSRAPRQLDPALHQGKSKSQRRRQLLRLTSAPPDPPQGSGQANLSSTT